MLKVWFSCSIRSWTRRTAGTIRVGSILLLLALTARAEDKVSDAMYVQLTPGMVINYGEPSISRLKYLKVGVQVRVQTADHADLIEHHLPALQDALVMCFSSVAAESVSKSSGQEEIRQLALEAVQELIEVEEGAPIIQDLLFSSFVVQR